MSGVLGAATPPSQQCLLFELKSPMCVIPDAFTNVWPKYRYFYVTANCPFSGLAKNRTYIKCVQVQCHPWCVTKT